MIKFGTGGWRAVVGDDFTKANVVKVVEGIIKLSRSENKDSTPIVIGYDRRMLSRNAAEWVEDTLHMYGINTYMFDQVPTPLVMHFVMANNLNYGIMITASHNPYTYNGIKLIVEGGKDASKEVTDALESIIENNCEPLIPNEESGTRLQPEINPVISYYNEIFKHIDLWALLNPYKKPLKISFNGMHGSGSAIFIDLMRHLRCNFQEYDTDMDIYFNGTAPEPKAEYLSEYMNYYKSQDFDIGLVFDGDGDRLLVLDEQGNIVDMNMLLCIYYWYMKEIKHLPGGVVKNLVTTSNLDRLANNYGEHCYEVPVGFKWITSTIDATDAIIGGESSGGMAIKGYNFGKDSIFASMFLIEVLSNTGVAMSELPKMINDAFGARYTSAMAMMYNPEQAEEIRDYIYNEFPAQYSAQFPTTSSIDGVKLSNETGSWVCCRFSGTEPMVRIMGENDSEEELKQIIGFIYHNLVEKFG